MKPLQVLSDCTGIPINEWGFNISGTKIKNIKVAKGITIKLQGRIVSGFNNEGCAGILIKLKGNLYLATLYSTSRETISSWIIDSSLLGLDDDGMLGLLDSVETLRICSDIIKTGVIQGYYSKVNSHNGLSSWQKLSITI